MSEESSWTQKKCKPCEGGVTPLAHDDVMSRMPSFLDWVVDDDSKSIRARFVMKNFETALKLVNEIGAIAEEEDHHPDLHLTGYRNLEVVLTTHAIQGLSDNDFILAAKISNLPKSLKEGV